MLQCVIHYHLSDNSFCLSFSDGDFLVFGLLLLGCEVFGFRTCSSGIEVFGNSNLSIELPLILQQIFESSSRAEYLFEERGK